MIGPVAGRRLLFASVCALAALALSAGASAGPSKHRPSPPVPLQPGGATSRPAPDPAARHGHIGGIVPSRRAVSRFAGLGSGNLVYNGGPVMHTSTTYAIYWVPPGYSVDANYESVINGYFQNVAAASGAISNVYAMGTEYYDTNGAIAYDATFGGSVVDTDAFPSAGCSDSGLPLCLTDAQVQAEIDKVVAQQGWTGGLNHQFFIFTPKTVGSCFDSGSSECAYSNYCAYHGYFSSTLGNGTVIYANHPYTASSATPGGCDSGEHPNNDDADPTINVISHEHNEAITDPAGDAWLNSKGNEIGDICAWTFGANLGTIGGQAYNQVINGHYYDLQEEYSNEGSACLQHFIPSVSPVSVASPVLSGAAGESRLLSTSEGSWMHAPSGYAYRWQRCAANGAGCADIAGATAATYRLTTADVGHTIRSEVSAHNTAGTSTFTTSAPSAAVVALPSATASPTLTGVAGVGKTLSTTTGAWNTTVTAAYAWLRCADDGSGCVAIPRATAATYVLVPGDAGHTLEAQVSATNAAGTTSALSNRSAVVVALPAATKAPHISGRARIGRRLSASLGTWSGPPTAYRYQWLRCTARGGSCKRIAHATQSTYRLTKRDAGHRLRVAVTAVDPAGSTTATSRATTRVPTARRH